MKRKRQINNSFFSSSIHCIRVCHRLHRWFNIVLWLIYDSGAIVVIRLHIMLSHSIAFQARANRRNLVLLFRIQATG